MLGDEPKQIQSLLSVWGVDHATLTAVVSQALGLGSITVAEVQGCPIYGGASGIGQGVAGVYRVIGKQMYPISFRIECDV